MKARTKERLLHLASFMSRMPEEHWDKFDMGTWLEVDGDYGNPISPKVKGEGCSLGLTHRDLYECGTRACALGWAASLPKFQRLGLTHDLRVLDTDEKGRPTSVNVGQFCINGKTMMPTAAAMKFFGLTDRQAGWLFGGGVGDTPKDWARECREFVRNNGEGY